MRRADTLSFSIFGVARSGTTALTAAANLHPAVFCSHEWHIGGPPEHASLVFPQAYFDRDDLMPLEKHRQRDRDLLTGKLEARNGRRLILGNKVPTYFWHFDRLTANFPLMRHHVIYRSPFGFMPSWDERSDKSVGPGWPRGKTGLFGLFELLLLMDTVANHPERISVVSYDALYFGGTDVFARWMERIVGMPTRPVTERLFTGKFLNRRTPDSAKDRPNEHAPFLHEIGVAEVDDAVRSLALGEAGAVADLFRAWVSTRAEPMARYVAEAVAQSETPEVPAFARLWAGDLARTFPRQPWRDPALRAAGDGLIARIG